MNNWRYKIVVFGSTIWALTFPAGCVEPQPDVMNIDRLREVRRIAVAPFSDGPGGNGTNSGNAVAGFIINRLSQSGRFTLVERSQLNRVLEEKNLQASDLVDRDKATEVGKIAGVDAIVIGSVNQYDSEKTVVYIYVVPIVAWSYRVGANIQFVDVKDGTIIYSYGMAGSSGRGFNEAGTQAAEKIVSPMLIALSKAKPPESKPSGANSSTTSAK